MAVRTDDGARSYVGFGLWCSTRANARNTVEREVTTIEAVASKAEKEAFYLDKKRQRDREAKKDFWTAKREALTERERTLIDVKWTRASISQLCEMVTAEPPFSMLDNVALRRAVARAVDCLKGVRTSRR